MTLVWGKPFGHRFRCKQAGGKTAMRIPRRGEGNTKKRRRLIMITRIEDDPAVDDTDEI